jgi:hypothetical protein
VNANAAPLSIGGLFLHADIGRIVFVRADRAVSYASLIDVLGSSIVPGSARCRLSPRPIP